MICIALCRWNGLPTWKTLKTLGCHLIFLLKGLGSFYVGQQKLKAAITWNFFDIYNNNNVEAWKYCPGCHKPIISLHYAELKDSINGSMPYLAILFHCLVQEMCLKCTLFSQNNFCNIWNLSGNLSDLWSTFKCTCKYLQTQINTQNRHLTAASRRTKHVWLHWKIQSNTWLLCQHYQCLVIVALWYISFMSSYCNMVHANLTTAACFSNDIKKLSSEALPL